MVLIISRGPGSCAGNVGAYDYHMKRVYVYVYMYTCTCKLQMAEYIPMQTTRRVIAGSQAVSAGFWRPLLGNGLLRMSNVQISIVQLLPNRAYLVRPPAVHSSGGGS